jgi:hypothetical protein
MKYVVMSFLSLSFCSLSAQSTEEREDSLYVIIYSKGPSWDNAKSPNEQLYFKEHSGFMGKLRKDGYTKLGARYSDKGMIIIGAASMKAAKDLIASDTAVVQKLFITEIQKLNVFYEGCLERPR